MLMANPFFSILDTRFSRFTMRFHLVLWLFLMSFDLINSSISLAVTGYCVGHQRNSLLHLKNTLTFNHLKSKKLVFWNQSDDCCQWLGVTCSKGRVIALDLSQESISSGLDDSSALFNLQYLQSLNLAFNNFHSVIPPELHRLENLKYLNLSNAGFQGQIPNEISCLKRLVNLDLSSSFNSHIDHRLKLEKPNIAMLVQNLTNITELYLDGVAILAKGKEWCDALSSMKELRVLSLSSCNLSGPINSSLAKLQSLSVIKLNQNNMSSTVPESFANFSNLTTLQLSNCGLSGSFPNDIFQIRTLQVLDISDNPDLYGSLPNFTPLVSLHTLNLSNTNFLGQLPNAISNLKKLSTLDLSNCKFNGTLHNSMPELTKLVHLDLSSNNFTGPLPSFNMSKNLTYLSLSNNHLSGVLPSSHFEGLINLVSIKLGFNLFNGSVPSSLLELSCLRELMIPHNQLNGMLGEFLNASSSVLEIIDLQSNNLEGHIPMSIFNLRRLCAVVLSSNKFSGTIQLYMIQKLSSLVVLDLSHNNLSVDANFRDDHNLSLFPNMIHLLLASCNLRKIPRFLKNQSTLQKLDLSSNKIQGAMPVWIWKLESLIVLNLSRNSLTNLEGSFLNFSSNLFVVDLSSNQLQGPISFFPRYAIYLDYSSNRFSSIIPADIGNHLHSTVTLYLSNNSFHGQIHKSFCNASSLRRLDLSYNNFSGMIPQCFATLSSTLKVLNLGGNKLHGYIFDKIPASCALRFFDLNDNLLGGTIPTSLVNCQKLQVLNLGKNLLIDKFPCFLNNISTLRIMVLRANKFHGSIGCPNSIGKWEMLHIVDIASNNFSGIIPEALLKSWKAMMPDRDEGPEFGHLFLEILDNYNPTSFKDVLSAITKDLAEKLAKLVKDTPRFIFGLYSSNINFGVDLSHYQDSVTIINKGQQMKLIKIQKAFTYLDLSSNYFEGAIPNELMNFKALNGLNLSHNGFMGHIPSSIGNLKNLESLDLSNNSLSGRIPTQLASLSFLSYLNLSFNHLVGEIPMGTQIQSFDIDSFEGNEELCGLPLTKNCSDDSSPTSKITHSHSRSSIDWNFLSAELGFTFGFGIFILPLIVWKRWRVWYCKHVDEMLCKIIPQLGFVYDHHGGQTYKTLRWKPY